MPVNEKLKGLLPRVAFVVGCALFAVVASNQYIQAQLTRSRTALEAERQRIRQEYPEPVQVVVAAKDVPEGVAIDASLIRPGAVPEKFIQPYAAREPSQVLGLVTVAQIASGEQVLLNKLRRPEEVPAGALLSTVVPKGKRAVTIVVDTITGVGGFVRPGDIVDVVWTIGLPEGKEGASQLITMTLFQDVPVMAVGHELPGRLRVAKALKESETSEGGESDETVEEAQAVSQPSEGVHEYTVTLALAPQEISFLLFAREQGRVQLSLRPRDEKGSQVAVAPVNMTTMLAAMLGIQATQGPPPKVDRKVELFKGLDRDVVVLSEQDEGAQAQ